MSVINQMLKDLQRRQGAAGVADALPPARHPASRAAWWWGWAAAAALAAAWVYVSWGAASAPPPAAALAPPSPAPHAAPSFAAASEAIAAAEVPAEAEPGHERAPAPQAEPVARTPSTLPDPGVAAAPADTTTSLALARAPSLAPTHEAEAAPRLEAAVAPVPGAADEGRAVAAGTPPSTSSTMQRRVRPLSDRERGELAYRRALTELDAGEETPARAALREALVLAPAHRDAAELLAALLVRSTHHEEAQRVLEAALRHRPGDPGLTQLLAHAHVHAGRIEAAVAALERHPPSLAAQPEYHALLAALYQQLGRHGAAAQGYRALLQVDPQHAAWWVGLAISLEGRGHWSEALGAYRRALELDALTSDLARYAENRVTVLERARR